MKNQNMMFTRSVPKMSKGRLFRSVLALGIVALIMQVSPPRAQAYDLSSLNGSYAGNFSGLTPISGGPPPSGLRPITHYAPEYIAGLFTFDGAGGCTALMVFNFGNGLIFGDNWDLNLHWTYTVNANGTGSMTLPDGHRVHFVIGAGGNELKTLSTAASEVDIGSMVKQ
jgi:hypothetical protein